MSTTEKFVLPTFTGKKEDFQVWWIRFEAYANLKGFKAAFEDPTKGEDDLPATEKEALDLTKDDGKKKKEALDRNAMAVSCFTVAFTTTGLLAIVTGSRNGDWPNGRSWIIAGVLITRYKPEDILARSELRAKLFNIKMKETDEPSVLFDAIEKIKGEHITETFSVDESEFISAVISVAPKSRYGTMLANEVNNKSVTLADLQTKMEASYRVFNIEAMTQGKSEAAETSLTTTDSKAKCWNCGKVGHKKSECPSLKTNGNNNGSDSSRSKKFNGVCNLCGKKGHKAADCWDSEANKDKRPDWYKPKKNGGEASGAAVGGELVLSSICGVCKDQSKNKELSLAMTFPDDIGLLDDENIWVGDTGASCHSTSHKVGMIDCVQADKGDSMTAQSGGEIIPDLIGNIPGTVHDKEGNPVGPAVLKEVMYNSGTNFNLFSIPRMLSLGWNLKGDKDALVITKDGMELRFDIKITTKRGALYCMYMKRNSGDVVGAQVDSNDPEESTSGMSSVKNEMKPTIGIEKAHHLFGHASEDETRKTAEALGYRVVRGTLKPCDACTAAKAKQKNVPKASEHVPAGKPNERVFLDISTIKKCNDIKFKPAKGKWCMIVDECTQLKFSDFYDTKNGMVEPTCEKFKKWSQDGKPVGIVRLDNAGENVLLQQRANSADWQLGIDFEFTPRNTPQQNHLVEVGFAIVANKGRALMHHANIPIELRYKLFREALMTATLLDGLAVITLNEVKAPRFMHYYGHMPKWVKHLRTWGEAGTVTIKSKMQPKLKDRGVQCMFVGYSMDHDGDVYRMFNPATSRIVTTRDVIWMRRMYYAKPKVTADTTISTFGPFFDKSTNDGETPNDIIEEAKVDENDDTNDEKSDTNQSKKDEDRLAAVEEESVHDSDDDSSDSEDEKQYGRGHRKSNPPRRWIVESEGINALFDPTPDAVTNVVATEVEATYLAKLKEIESFENATSELALVGAGVGGGFENTQELHVMKYDEAMAGPDADKWKQAVEEEYQRMLDHNVWKPVPIEDVPKDAKILSSTWAMKKKSNGVYRARVNARGYEQVDGEHYDSKSIAAPVTNDMTIRVVLVLMIMAEWLARILDVKGAFLCGKMKPTERVYMGVPQGFEKHYKNVLLLLLATLYGLKQAAMAFWVLLLSVMKKMNYQKSDADPCLYFKWEDGTRLNIWLSWVDDLLNLGKEADVNRSCEELKKHFDCDDLGKLEEYVGCKIDYNKAEGSLKFTQPVILQSFNDEFDLPDKSPVTPAEAGQVLVKVDSKNAISANEQTKYRSGVGKLLHLERWSRPEIQNSVRELSRHCQQASKAHVKAMLRVMKYCVSTPNRGWLLKPNRKWDGSKDFEFEVSGCSDSNYAKCPDTRRSVSGYSAKLEGVPISAKSSTQKIVALSVTEAELFAAVQCAQDMLYIMRLLESMDLKVKKPMILHVDNKGAVDLANNWSVGGRTRHVEVKQHFLRDMKEQGLIRVEWLPTAENDSDLFTKNLGGPEFNKHTESYCGDDDYYKSQARKSVAH